MTKPHLETAHTFWKDLISPQDIVIDATCGNGYDTYLLSQLAAKVYSIDIQQQALETAKSRLTENQLKKVCFVSSCHSTFPSEIAQSSVKLIVYNLGYLPGGDKSVTTQTATTLKSLNNGMPLIAPGGALSITCYPGHSEGKNEEKAIEEWVESIDKDQWSFCHHRWIYSPTAPSLLILKKLNTR